ncbi:MAG: TetR/AcrR family transcriptional regulator [Eggerthellaceae bacterium]
MRLDKENQGIRPPGRERSAVESRRLGGPAGEIMLAARTLFERRGVGKTTVKDIAAEANVTRELVYYYFENKQAVVDAVLDDYVEDLVESVIVWNESRRFGDTSGSLRACIATFRRALYDAEGNQRPMIAVLEELGVRDAFDVRAVRETVDCLSGRVLVEYAEYHQVEIEFVYEMFCVVIFGLVGLVKIDPDISDEALMKVVEQTLHLDMEPLALDVSAKRQDSASV